MEPRSKVIKKKHNTHAYFKQKQRKAFGSQQTGHGRAFLEKKAVVRQHLRLKNKIEAKEKKKLQYNQNNSSKEDSTEAQQNSSTEAQQNSSTESQQNSSTEAQQNILPDTIEEEDSPFSSSTRKNRPNNLVRARAEYKKKIEEKQQKEEEVLMKKQEAEEAKKRYKEKRLHRFKKLNQKTRKGQPLMRGKIELMLETLQQSSNS